MRFPASFAALVLLLTVTRVAESQSYTIDRCRPSRDGIGAVVATGRVRYALGKDGIPDTASLGVLAVERISAAGYRSVVARLLSGCTMKRPDAPLAVEQAIRFDTGGAHLTPAIPSTDSAPPLALEVPPAPSGPVEVTDSALEERPSWLTCDRPPRTQTPTVSGRSAAADQSMFAAASPLNSGAITARILIGSDGRVVKDSITLVSTTNPQNTSNLMRALASCRYAPGRIGGVPVATRSTTSMWVGANGYSVTTSRLVQTLIGH